ncbi:MAG: lytic transglycosylase domain-containing protein [Acetobacteraceae bacterium]|nr:lytic transglycosylase domain-containing protein [Acetobacteraceae bacterium]
MAVPFLPCMALVAQIYALPPRVLPSIQHVEGGQPGLVHTNSNGSQDLGIMQINTIWLPYLSAYTHLSPAEVRERLLGRACFNIAAAGLIMRLCLDETGGDLLRAVGNYHSHTAQLNQAYQAQVLRSATLLFIDRQAGRRP